MTLPRNWLRGLAFAGVAATGYVFGITSDRASAQPQPAPGGALPGTPVLQPAAPTAPLAQPDRRVVAYITNNNQLVPITREELGDYLIARGGHKQLELLVNKRIIEIEAARRGVTVTTVELRAKLEEVLRGLSVSLKDFEDHILPRYGKSLYEYVEDVLRSELLLTKMVGDRIQISEEELKRAFDNKYGERRQAKVICWNKGDGRAALRQWEEARRSDADFDRIARLQPDSNLGSGAGLVAPIGRHGGAKDKVEETLFNLKVGEMSQLFDVEAGVMCVKLVAIIPPDTTVPFDDKMKAQLRKELVAKRMDNEVGKLFGELKKHAQPQLYLKAPSAEEFRKGVAEITNQVPTAPK
ncbi:MAG: hypothetical protein FJ304_18905 [Planctomycetes bacterium]|nr:hypothetical protein [Planctomycetota bacterium]